MSDAPAEVLEQETPTEHPCVGCGCTESKGCENGCVWVLEDPYICSDCLDKVLLDEGLLAEIGAKFFEFAIAITQATERIGQLEAQTQALVNIMTVLVNREGGSVRLRPSEFDGITGFRLESRHDADSMTQIVEVKKIDPETGEPVSSIIIPGIVLPFGG